MRTAKTLNRLGIRPVHMPFCWFCYEAADIDNNNNLQEDNIFGMSAANLIHYPQLQSKPLINVTRTGMQQVFIK